MNKIVFILILIMSCGHPVFAAPHITKGRPEPRELPGQSPRERFSTPMDGVKVMAPASYPASTVKILFLRVEFQQDTDPSTTGSGLWNDPMYAQGDIANADDPEDPAFNYWITRAKTKFMDYWSQASYGMFPMAVTVSPKIYRLPRVMSFYGNESKRALENLIYDSVSAASADNIEFSLYDVVLIVHAGCGEETDQRANSSGDIWSLYYDNQARDQAGALTGCISRDAANAGCLDVKLADDRLVHEAIIMPQSDTQDGVVVDPLGVYVHEFGHWLGLPDLYCTSSSPPCNLDGVGKWSLMGDGIYNQNSSDCPPGVSQCFGSSPARPDAWSLIKLGWAVPRTITGDESVRLNPVASPHPSQGPAAPGTEILKAQASSSASSQYFLIENRQLMGFDSGLPGHGLLVWLIDDAVVNGNFSSNSVNNDAGRLGIKLLEADGDGMLLSSGCSAPDNCGSPGDPFPGTSGTAKLTPLTDPSTLPYSGFGMVNIRNIAEADGPAPKAATFDIGFAPLPPMDMAMDRDAKTMTWTASSGAVSYVVYKNGSHTPYATLGSQTSFTDSDSHSSDVYRVVAVDLQGNESQAAETASVLFANPATVSGGGTGGGVSGGAAGSGAKSASRESDKRCFIATAAFGSYLDPHVEALRGFRDRYLLTNAAGRVFVAFYYRNSPPVAALIGRHESLRTITRGMLTPVVLTVNYPLQAMLLVIAGVAIAVSRTKTLRRN